MFKPSGYRKLALSLLTVGLSATAMGGGAFLDSFDQYADQAALGSSIWNPADGKADGQLDMLHALGTKAMRHEQTPVETRASRTLGTVSGGGVIPFPGRLDLWFYDDGADIKAFDISVTNSTSTASIGLRDNQVASATNYVCTLNAVEVDTLVQRSEGWHVVQFAVNLTTGTVIQVDKQDFPGNTLPALTTADKLIIYTNRGNTSDQNQVWIDTVRWIEGDASATLPADPYVTIIEHFVDVSAWSPMGTMIPGDVHHITNAGTAGTNNCLDVYAQSGARGVQGTISGAVPFDGKYRLGFDYENGGAYGGGIGPWENLTVTMNGASSVNVGSAQVNSWLRRETTTAIALTTTSDVNIQVTADSTPSNGFCRFDSLALILTEFTPPPSSARDWQLY